MGCLEPRKVPMPPLPPPGLLVHAPSPPQGRTHSPGLRSPVGHSNLPSIPSPSHDPLLLWPSLCPPAVPHPHFWPELDRGNSSWQTPKAGMREIHKPDVLLRREGSGGWGVKGRGALRAPVPQQHPFGPRQGDWRCTSPTGQGSTRVSRDVKELPFHQGWWRKP